ncbi:MAG: putative flavin-nucleotide-binding protein [Bacillota bacterium]|nr:putative flavin-nucleotide-binding protein [Bacillota bacterium]
MFREMRRKNQLLQNEKTIEILKKCSSGILGVIGDDGYPYTVPVSYIYNDGKLYFHCANKGHKLDSIKRNDKVTFCVVEKDDVIQETFTTHFSSVIVFGKARILDDDSEKLNVLKYLVEKYSPDFIEESKKSIERSWNNVSLVEVKIEHMTGKAAIEIINEYQG